MTYRHPVCKGDKTTANGVVQSGNPNHKISNRELAYEGDKIWCESCKSMGEIVCSGPRLSMTGPDGRRIALSGDACACRCRPRPKLLASQRTSYMDM
ncbi:putative Zn-binding protein involved in type VI secretion [Herbaspirillum sp. Sphag1AN]|uniref:PAAR domain-containing protein n=1 Tax=unclassified Herbaspirillum TaxID=2624150 RepID=UPI00161E821B|nr:MULTISPECIES: PAAR domain-containing protein [unclassified Herbaspirillum]MBB3213270.1 putative Zn-binding protein involved in type VI secretion [Herbaspirillum sp. Sphag1AN]MBB3246467.1 putative Zn-binding protein involved in type VI secretion [Herbaspirillum sp. Sphag64]